MRLIDGDKLKRKVQRIATEAWMMKLTASVETTLNQFIDYIDEAPTLDKPQWIPCSERLPDAEKKIYWVCTDSGYQYQCRWTNVNHFWTNLTIDWHWHIEYSKVVAWRKLQRR